MVLTPATPRSHSPQELFLAGVLQVLRPLLLSLCVPMRPPPHLVPTTPLLALTMTAAHRLQVNIRGKLAERGQG